MPQTLLDVARDGDVVLTMGAGSIGACRANWCSRSRKKAIFEIVMSTFIIRQGRRTVRRHLRRARNLADVGRAVLAALQGQGVDAHAFDPAERTCSN
jgi:hypothetical protein